jgi:hypothetical protein
MKYSCIEDKYVSGSSEPKSVVLREMHNVTYARHLG